MRYFMEAHEHRAAAIAVQAVAAAQRSRSAAWAMDWVAESVLVLSMYKLLLVMEPARIATKRRVAAVQQVSRPDNRKTGAPEGALRTATVKVNTCAPIGPGY